MKGVAQKSASPAAKVQRRPAAPAKQRKDGHELQAERAGRAFLRGEKRLSQTLTPSPAAGFTLPGSRGEPLPMALQAELEAAFDADLAIVRIHRDGPAHAAVQDFGALAFASGANIFFGAGRFDPIGEGGRELLAHEVAHVLQQTGRVTVQGRLQSRPIFGNSAVQCQEVPDFESLRPLHAPGRKGKEAAKYDEVANELATQVKNADAADAVETFARTSLPKIAPEHWPAQAESLVYDTLKRFQKLETATQLIERDKFLGGSRVKTAVETPGLRKMLEKRNGGWAVYIKAINATGWLKDYESEWLRLFEVFVFRGEIADLTNPKSPGGAPTRTIYEHAKSLQDNLQDEKTVSENEWIFGGLLLLHLLDNHRILECDKIRKKYSDSDRNLQKQKFALAVAELGNDLVARFASSKAFPSSSNGEDIKRSLKPYLTGLGKKISATAQSIRELFGQSVRLENLIGVSSARSPANGNENAKTLEDRRKLAAKLGDAAGLPSLLAKLLQEAETIGAKSAGGPDPVEFRSRIKPIADQMTALREEKLETPQADLFREKKTEELLALMALSQWLGAYLGDLLRLMKPPDASRKPPQAPTPTAEEIRLRKMAANLGINLDDSTAAAPPMRAPLSTAEDVRFHRLRLARQTRNVAKPLGWTAAVEAADALLSAAIERQSVLAIRAFDDGELWKLDPVGDTALVERARRDSDQEISGWPITLPSLMQFYTAQFYDAYARQIDKLLQAGPSAPYLASQAYRAVAIQRPQRWKARDFEFAKNPNDSREFGDLIRSHPSFQALDSAKKAQGYVSIVPLGPSNLWVWFVPPLGKLKTALRDLPMLNALVAAGYTTEPDPQKRLQWANGLSADEWFERLVWARKEQIKNAPKRTDWAAVLAASTQLTKNMQDAALGNLRIAYKRAMLRDRPLIAGMLRVNLGRFEKNPYDFNAIFELVRLIREFYGVNMMLEAADRELELAALLLEIAPELNSSLKHAIHFDIVYSVIGILEQGRAASAILRALPGPMRGLLLTADENRNAWIDPRIGELDEITQKLAEMREAEQTAQGFRADKDLQRITASVKLSKPLPVPLIVRARYGNLLFGEASSRAWNILEVLNSFVFHPSYGDAPGSKAKPSDLKSGYRPLQLLEADGKTPLSATVTELLKVQRMKLKQEAGQKPGWVPDGKVRTVKRDDKDLGVLLDEINNGITVEGFLTAMATIQTGIERLLNYALDVLQLIPGVGSAVAAARITASIADFISSGELDEIVGMFSGGFKDIVDGLKDVVENGLDADKLLILLLFGDPRIDFLIAHCTLGSPRPKTADGGGKEGTLGKTVNALRRLGLAVLKVLRVLVTRVEHPMQDIRSFATTRPLVSFSLNFAADHILQIVTTGETLIKVIEALEEGKKSGADDPIENLKIELKDEFGGGISQILGSFETLTLPERVIDVAPAISRVLIYAESLIVKRAGFAGEIFFTALKGSGAANLLNDKIAEAFRDHIYDPNDIWRKQIVPGIEGAFNDTRRSLVGELNGILAQPVFGGLFSGIPTVSPMTVDMVSGKQFEETGEDYSPKADEAALLPSDTNPSPSPDRPLRLRPDRVPDFDEGAPLTWDLRSQFEARLGQDLGHVRIHAGSAGGPMTEAFGADALTSGSHVFLRPGRAPERDQDLLAHELGHVVQQSGPRPLGPRYDETPVRGHPERGLDFDPAREAEADDMAGNSRGRSGSRQGRANGLQPSGVNWFTIARLLREESNLEALKRQTTIRGTEPKQSTLPTEASSIVDKVLTSLKTQSVSKKKSFESVINLAQERVKGYDKLIAKAAGEIAREALVPDPAPQGTNQHLSARHFARQLEGYILGLTGLAFIFDLNETKFREGGKSVKAVDPANPVGKITLNHIHLPDIGGNAKLWSLAMENTWKPPAFNDEDRNRRRKVLRLLLDNRGIAPGVWSGEGYAFSRWLVEQTEKDLKAQAGKIPDPVPSWRDYVKTDMGLSDKIGLRLAWYDHPSQQSATGRESHHLTQFLLADFFSNANNAKAFDPKRSPRDYPGVSFKAGNEVAKIAAKENNPEAKEIIDVERTKGQGRGAEMPTLSLAAATHQRGKLHVTQEADESEDSHTTKKTQGNTLKNKFIDELGDLGSANPDTYRSYFRDHSRDDAAQTIYRAAQSTYSMVETHMSRQLENNMPKLEYDYYLGLVEGADKDLRDKSNPDRQTPEQQEFLARLRAIPNLAKAHNKKLMQERFGWKT